MMSAASDGVYEETYGLERPLSASPVLSGSMQWQEIEEQGGHHHIREPGCASPVRFKFDRRTDNVSP